MFKKTGLVVAGLLVAGVASAQGVYVGGSLGQSRTSFGSEFQPNDPGDVMSFDKRDTAYKLFAGYEINKYFAIEGGYADLGEPKVNVTYPGGWDKGTQESSAWFVVGKGTLPISEQFNVFGKVGVTRNKVKSTWTDNTGGKNSTSDSRSRAMYGVGAEYNVTKQVGIRMEYENFGKFGDYDAVTRNGTGRTKTSLWSVGVGYKF